MGVVLDQFGKPYITPRTRSLRQSSYDINRNTPDNAKWWAAADFLSPDATNSYAARRYAVSRCRQEVANNSICDGIVDTLANDTIGRGPRLQVPLDDESAGEFLETEFMGWLEEIGFSHSLWLGRAEVAVAGEIIYLFRDNPRLNTPVTLMVQALETDRLTTPTPNITDPDFVDGIEFDEFGNPTIYHLLRHHPGSALGQPDVIDPYPADRIILWKAVTRVEQHRGFPEIAPAVPLFAALRRFREATISAAEKAADPAAILSTDNPLADMDGQDLDPMEVIEWEPGMMLTMPANVKLMQMIAEHPATTYEMFVREITKEALRCVSMPYIVASGDSSNANYSSGRLDHQVYHKAIRVMQSQIERVVLRRLWFAWLDEAASIHNYLPGGLPIFTQIPITWFWDPFPHVDPLKEAEAAASRIASFISNRKIECAREGTISKAVLVQAGKEKRLMLTEGLIDEQEPATNPTQ